MTELARVIEQMSTLIATPSISSTDPQLDSSNESVIAHLATWATELGFRCEIMTVAPGKANLIATLGEGPGGLVLSGHTDTVPCDASGWHSDPFQGSVRDGQLFGLGSADMKGFFPLALAAAHEAVQLVRQGRALKAPVILLATCDEETSMAGARALVEAGLPSARFAVIGEPTGLQPLRLHKGMMMERIRLTGQSGHSSDPSLGHNALDAMHDVISDLKAFRLQLATQHHNPLFSVPTPTLNLGCIHGGDNPNRICAQCELQYDLRPLPGMDMEALRQAITQRVQVIAERHQVQAECAPLFTGTPPLNTPAESPLVAAVEALTGHMAGAAGFGTEGPYLQALGMDALILGPGRIEVAHQPNEYVALDALSPTITILQALIKRFCLPS